MENTIYEINGSLDQLSKVLQNDLKLEDYEAICFAKILACDQYEPEKDLEIEDGVPWDLNLNSPSYRTAVFKSRYTICFTKAQCDIFKDLLSRGLIKALGLQSLSIGNVVWLCIKHIVMNTTVIYDDRYCVYLQALSLTKEKNNNVFSAEDIYNSFGFQDGIKLCINLEKDWKCPQRVGDKTRDCCSYTVEKLELVLEKFCDDDIFEPLRNVQGFYRFKF